MSSRSDNTYIIGAWGILVLATAVSWWFGTGHGLEAASVEGGSVAILALAFAKIGLVGHSFMELRHSMPKLEAIFLGWCAAICAMLIVMYLVI
jgi:hypothetical protein